MDQLYQSKQQISDNMADPQDYNSSDNFWFSSLRPLYTRQQFVALETCCWQHVADNLLLGIERCSILSNLLPVTSNIASKTEQQGCQQHVA